MPRQRPLWRLLALLSLLLLVAAACGDDDDEAATDDGATATTEQSDEGGGGDGERIAIAFVGPLTGDAANLGINIRNGARVAVEEANEEGGDYEFVLKEFDTQGDPAQAPTVLDKYINDEEIVGIVGPTFSGETRAVLPTLEENGLVMVSASATNTQLPEVVPGGAKVFHRVVPDDDVQGASVADYIVKNLGGEKVAYVHDNSEYGKGLAEGTKTFVEKAGGDTALVEAIDPKSQDYSAAVTKVKAAEPDVIFYGGYYAEGGRLKKQLTDAGVEGTFVSGDGALDQGFVESGGAGAEGAQLTCACNIANEEAEEDLAAFAGKYEELNNADPGTYSVEGYDAAGLLIEGIKAGNDTRETLLEYVEGLDSYEGLSKEISFEENGNIKAGGVFFFEVKAGKITLLGTTDELVK